MWRATWPTDPDRACLQHVVNRVVARGDTGIRRESPNATAISSSVPSTDDGHAEPGIDPCLSLARSRRSSCDRHEVGARTAVVRADEQGAPRHPSRAPHQPVQATTSRTTQIVTLRFSQADTPTGVTCKHRPLNRSDRERKEPGADDSTSTANSAAKRAVTGRNEAIPGIILHRT